MIFVYIIHILVCVTADAVVTLSAEWRDSREIAWQSLMGMFITPAAYLISKDKLWLQQLQGWNVNCTEWPLTGLL